MPPKKKKQPAADNNNAASVLPGAGTTYSLRQRCKIQSLSYELREKAEIASQASEARSAAEQERGVAMRMLAQEQSAHEATKKELTSTFLSMKESLTEKIVKLSSQIQELHDNRDEIDIGIEILKKNHNAALSKKDADIATLKAKMDDMAQEFKDMLQAVMSKMSERVALPEPERQSRGRVLAQGLKDAYKPKIIKSFDLE